VTKIEDIMQAKIIMLSGVFTLLTACGGSSSDVSPTPGPTPAPTAKLTAELKYSALKCDLTMPIMGADIIVHKQDGSILSQSKSTADGNINIDWPTEAKHISMVMNVDGETRVETFTEVVAGDLGRFKYTKSSLDSSCSCEVFNFDTSDVNAVYSSFTPLIDGSNSLSQTYCKNDGVYAPVNIVLMPSQSGVSGYAATLDLNGKDPNQSIVISSGLFGNSDNEGIMLNANILPTQPANVRLRTFSETEYGRVNWINWEYEPQVFSGLYTNNFFTASVAESMGGNEFGDLFYVTSSRIRVTDANAVLSLNLQQNQNQLLEQTNVILSGMVNDGPSAYDFSTIGTGKTLLVAEIAESGLARWSVEAPLSGTMPELILPDAIEAKFEQMSNPRMMITIYGYNTHNASQFNEYRKQRAVISRDTTKLRSSFFDNYVYELIDVSLSM
jgi:hypothetical protein